MACAKTLMLTNIAANGIVLQKKFSLNSQVRSLRHSIEEERSVSALKLRARKKSCATMVAINEGELITENSTTVKLSALVTVRNNNKVLGSEMVNNLLTIFFPQNHTKALLLQLVSTNLDPGTSQPSIPPFLFLVFTNFLT